MSGVSIEKMYETACEQAEQLAEAYDVTVHVTASEGNSGVVVGETRPHPQNIYLEFEDAVDDADVELQLLRLVNGTGWEVIGAERVREKPTDVEIYREVDPEDGPDLFEDDFSESQTFG